MAFKYLSQIKEYTQLINDVYKSNIVIWEFLEFHVH